MKTISSYDSIRDHDIGGMKIPRFEGHVKFKLHNCKNHKDEVIIEGKNLITNAVRDIFARNLQGGLNYAQILPIIQSYYGGVLLYRNAHTLNADNYYPQDDTNNPLVAHAGDQAPGSATIVAEDYGRGSPVSVVATESSIVQTWEWGTEQGGLHGGVISALSLTHKDTGNAGLGNTSSAFAAFNPFVNLSNLSELSVGGASVASGNNVMTQYDDKHGLVYLIGDDGDFYDGHHRISSNKITVYIFPLAYTKIGIWSKTIPNYEYVRKFTVSTSITFYGMPAYYFDITNKYLWLFNNKTSTSDAFSQTTVYYTVIDCVNGTEVTHGTIVSDDNDLGIIATDGNQNQHAYPHIVNILKEGNYVYLPLGQTPTSSQLTQGQSRFMGLKKIDITNQADQTLLLNQNEQPYSKPYFKNGDLIINGNRVFNSGVGYDCAIGYFTDNDAQQSAVSSWFLHEPDKVSSLAYPFRAYNGAISLSRRLLASKMLNTSLFNLPNGSVTKTGTLAMTVEYTIQEVSS